MIYLKMKIFCDVRRRASAPGMMVRPVELPANAVIV